MKSKNIIFTKPNTAEIIEQDVQMPEKSEILVKLAFSTISSGTERANLTGDTNINCYAKSDGKALFPRSSGYSSSGIVEAVGENITSIKVGDRVAMSWSKHSQYVTLPESNVYPIDDIDFNDAALFHISIFPLAAIRKCRLEIGESAIVMGMGILGLVALQFLKVAGAAPIIAVDPNPLKREKALKCGADYALDPYNPDFAERVKELTNGGANVGIEVTGIGKGLDGILDCMARFGRVALLGCTRNSDFSIDYYRKVHGPGITLIGAHTMARPNTESSPGWWTQKDDIMTVKKLTEMGRIKLSDIIDEVHSPKDAVSIYNRLSVEKTFPIVQFDWRLLK